MRRESYFSLFFLVGSDRILQMAAPGHKFLKNGTAIASKERNGGHSFQYIPKVIVEVRRNESDGTGIRCIPHPAADFGIGLGGTGPSTGGSGFGGVCRAAAPRTRYTMCRWKKSCSGNCGGSPLMPMSMRMTSCSW